MTSQNIRLQVGSAKAYIFIDEIQRKENAGLFLKGIYDMNLPYKFIVSGSGSLELKAKIHESMVGRKRMFVLEPLTFKEVDFVLEKGLIPIPFEVKYKKIEKVEIPRPLRSFITKYKPKNAYIVNLGQEFEVKIENAIVHLIPFYRLMGSKLENIR